jgi:hypothetical protein
MAKIDYKSVIWEATKEPLRLLAIALIPIFITLFTNLPYTWTAVIIILLRYIDSLLHEIGKVKKDDILITGLTRF